MKPRSKSVWMVPAAWGAVSPMWIVQARDSFSPAVRKVCRPRVRKPTWTSWTSPDSSCPYPASSSAASSGSRAATSASIWAQTTTASAGATSAASPSRTAWSPRAPSSTLKT